MIERVDSSSGDVVAQQLEKLSEKTGVTPCAVLSDQGYDVRLGGKMFCENRQTVAI